ncbi:beta-ketothiolase BktB [Sphingobium cupriresistens]|uniref:3-ketoacyl-CoA thiolase n=1 Tax=Sphingobium cupriresistens LL01 TaxID=1420583 RepID=A0A0J7Y068_9SPHN|nr:beta-ketothiolase BktB [Sphingobium cupriresistens]KMS56813.1 3-ketoacyl-CoA thiolase [Sphingobium cupriresistens LL01]
MTNIYVVAARRTAIGTFGGSLRDADPASLGAAVAKAALADAGLKAGSIQSVVFGQVIPTGPRDAYVARIAAMESGVPQETPAMTVNRLCGSGLQAIISAAQSLMLGDAEIALGGGTEVMSRAPFFAPGMRWGQKMGDATLVDGLNGALTDPFGRILMGVTAENVAERFGVTRSKQDELALLSQQRACHAIDDGRFIEQIVPIELATRKGAVQFSVDEHVRRDVRLEDLAKLRPIFKKEDGTVTAANASGINDGAAVVLLATEDAVKRHGLTPLARLVSYGHAGVDPALMGIGPVPASRLALEKAGLTVADLDVVESNEAFAAQACAVANELQFDPAKTNPNGSGISLGHPVGATGAIITVKLVHELQRISGRYGLATMCIGGGQGIAAIFERV